MVKSSKDKKAVKPASVGKSLMQDSFIQKHFEPKEISAENQTKSSNSTAVTDEDGQLYCVEIQSSSSSSTASNSKCIKYETCKKKATTSCCRGMCFECCRTEANDSSCTIHYGRQVKEDELDREFNAIVADLQGFKSFGHTEERLTRVCQTVVIWCLKDFLSNKNWCDDVFERHDRERRQKQLQLRRMYAFHTTSSSISSTSRNIKTNNICSISLNICNETNTLASDEGSGSSSLVSNNGTTTACSDNSSRDDTDAINGGSPTHKKRKRTIVSLDSHHNTTNISASCRSGANKGAYLADSNGITNMHVSNGDYNTGSSNSNTSCSNSSSSASGNSTSSSNHTSHLNTNSSSSSSSSSSTNSADGVERLQIEEAATTVTSATAKMAAVDLTTAKQRSALQKWLKLNERISPVRAEKSIGIKSSLG